MRSHGVHFQPPLSGALHVARTNAFFMGGGKALVNAYYRSAERWACRSATRRPWRRSNSTASASSRSAPRAANASSASSCVLAAGGFESNREWLREAWGQNERGEWPADNFLIRGTRFNQGVLLKHMIDAGADTIGDPVAGAHGGHRRPRAALRRRHLHAHRLRVAGRGGQPRGTRASTTKARTSGPSAMRSGAGWWHSSRARSATRSSTRRRSAASCRRCFRARSPTRCPNWHASSGWTKRRFRATPSPTTTPPAASARFDHTALDDCHTEGLAPAKTHWARPIDTPPFYGYALRPGHHLHLPGPEGRRHAPPCTSAAGPAPTSSWPAK